MSSRSRRVQIAFLFTTLMSVFVLVSIVLDAQAVVNIAAVVGTLISATTLYMSLSVEPTEENLNSAIIELARLLEDSWGNRMSLLLGRDDDRQAASQPLPACVKFSRLTNLELTSQPNLGSNGNWNTIYAAFYQKIRGGRLVITGDPGHGKTLLAIELVLQILRARNGGGSAENSLPVPVSVAGWDGTEDLPTWLTKRLKEEWHLSPTIGRTLIRRHLILPVLDGLDEIGARQDKEKPLDRQLRVLRRLNPSRGAMKGTEPVPIIVTCRIDDYQLLKKEVGGLLGAVVVKVLPLNRRLIKEYLRARFDPTMTLHTVDGAQWLEFANSLDRTAAGTLERCLCSPWYLSLAISACRAGETSVQELQRFQDVTELEGYVTESSVAAAVRLHPRGIRTVDSVIQRESREERTEAPGDLYDPEDVRKWLATLARHLDWQANEGMSSTNIDLLTIWRLSEVNGDHPRIIHTSVAVVGGVLAGALGGEFADGMAGVLIMSVAVAAGIGFGLWAGLRSEPRPSRVSFPRINETRGQVVIALAILVAVVGGIAGTLVGHSTAIGISEGVSAGFAAIILAGLGDRRVKALEPRDALRTDLFFGLALGVVYLAIGGLPGGLTGGILSHLHLNRYLTVPGSIAVALVIGMVAGVSLGSRCLLRYAISVTMEASRGNVPLTFERFMDWAYGAGILRISGVSYQFRHDKLRSSLAPSTKLQNIAP
jgi:hypothetical protein